MTKDLGPIKARDDRHAPGPIERGLMVVSAVLTVAILAYVGYHAWTLPDRPVPRAEVTGMETLPNGDVAVHVQLRNEGGVGLLTVEVEVDCATPPPAVAFDNVLAEGVRQGTVTCPPGTTNATARVASWVPA